MKEQAPRSLRYNIVLVGCRNAGKSSLINAITEQNVAIVSEIAGTTTDVVNKAYELLPLGPVTFVDTAGVDDDSDLGKLRIDATQKALLRADLALVIVGENRIAPKDKELLEKLKQMNVATLVVFTKADIVEPSVGDMDYLTQQQLSFVSVSATTGYNIDKLKKMIVDSVPRDAIKQTTLLEGLVGSKDRVVLVTPIDSSAPKGRLILPQVQVLREILDMGAVATVVQPQELPEAMKLLGKTAKIVITDSQAIKLVNDVVPPEIDLTTFSILFARLKGDLKIMTDGAKIVDMLGDGANVLIAEACSHHAQDDDIAKVKIPSLLKKYTQKQLNFSFCVGCNFPDNLEDFDLVVHCGACMLNVVEMNRRLKECVNRGVPITNYGIVISKTLGVLDRVIKPFGL